MSEELHPRADELDSLSTLELVSLIHAEDRHAVEAIKPALESIAGAIDAVTARMSGGGHLHYFGAGTSGWVARMDAAECPATFGVAAEVVQAHAVVDEDEDDRAAGARAVRDAALGRGDVAIGISASGGTAFVLGALEEARARGALTVSLTSNVGSRLGREADIAVEVETGPEIIAGSTRLKAGTVQKLVLNMLSTAVFTRLGHTHRGRMVGVVASNEKLRERAARIVADLTGVTIDDARARLGAAGGDIRAVLAEVQRP